MTAFPNPAYDGQTYTIGTRSWTYSLTQDAWRLNKNGPTGPQGDLGPTGPAGVLLTSLVVDTFMGDGVTDTFTLSITPISVYNMIVNVDGLVQTALTNYNVLSDQIIFSIAPIENSTIDVIHFLTGAPITGPVGYTGATGPFGGPPGPTGPTGYNSTVTGPTGASITGPTGPLNNSNIASGLVNAGTFITLDNIMATVTTTSNRGLSIATVSNSFDAIISGTYGYTGGSGGSSTTGTINTVPSTSLFNWNFNNTGDGATYIITDTTNSKAYRITMQINSSYNNNFISIERLL